MDTPQRNRETNVTQNASIAVFIPTKEPKPVCVRGWNAPRNFDWQISAKACKVGLDLSSAGKRAFQDFGWVHCKRVANPVASGRKIHKNWSDLKWAVSVRKNLCHHFHNFSFNTVQAYITKCIFLHKKSSQEFTICENLSQNSTDFSRAKEMLILSTVYAESLVQPRTYTSEVDSMSSQHALQKYCAMR